MLGSFFRGPLRHIEPWHYPLPPNTPPPVPSDLTAQGKVASANFLRQFPIPLGFYGLTSITPKFFPQRSPLQTPFCFFPPLTKKNCVNSASLVSHSPPCTPFFFPFFIMSLGHCHPHSYSPLPGPPLECPAFSSFR